MDVTMMFKVYLCASAFLAIVLNTSLVYSDNLALLSGTLRTYQKAACDEEWMNLGCPTGTTISIQFAQYGKVPSAQPLCIKNPKSSSFDSLANSNLTCLWPQAIQNVVGLCQKKSSCKFLTSPSTFGGDPCPGSRNYVEVAFKCRPSEFKSVIGCEGEVVQLKCNRSSRIAIYSASFGRTEYESIQCPQPKGVPEETCLSSYSTETVMQMCHGKRKCSLGVEPTTFGNPCKRESRMYLKVIHTCIPRVVLKEKYQGEPEPDEMLMLDGDSNGYTTTSIGGVIEQPSIYSPYYNNNDARTRSSTFKTIMPQQNHPSQPEEGNKRNDPIVIRIQNNQNNRSRNDMEQMEASTPHTTLTFDIIEENQSKINQAQARNSETNLVFFLSQGIHAYDIVSRNPEKLYLYIAISTASGLLILLIVLLVKFGIITRRSGTRMNTTTPNRNSDSFYKTNCTSKSSFSLPLGPMTSSLGEVDDELSIVMDPNDLHGELHHSIFRLNSPSDTHHEQQQLFPLTLRPSESSTTTSSTLSRKNEVVRFSNCPKATELGRYPEETEIINPTENIHFYYG